MQGQCIWALEFFLENCVSKCLDCTCPPASEVKCWFSSMPHYLVWHLTLCLRFGVGPLFQIKPLVFFFWLKIYQIARGTPLSCILRMLSNASSKSAVTEGVFLTVYLCWVNVYAVHVCGRTLAMARLYSQRLVCRSWVSPSTVWVPGMRFSSDFAASASAYSFISLALSWAFLSEEAEYSFEN